MAPGTYVFRVKASNNDGLYNQQGASIQLTVLPPWWRAPWAYILYAILAALVVWALVRYRSRQLRKANQLLERNVALRTEEVIRQKLEIETQRNNLADTLTELRDTQHQLIQREKLASLGELTAGIAHEIQNPLNFVNNFSDLSVDVVTELEDEQKRQQRDADLENELLDTLKQNLQKISHHGNRASSIVQGMLEHSRMGSGERYPVDLNALVDEYIRLAYYGQRVRNPLFTCALVQKLQPDLGKVDLVGQDISRVLLNLFNNAFYAVNQRLKQANDDFKPTVTVQTRIVDKAVEIQVSDNGTGISDTMQQKIFQPFFTTKPSGEGTGLGLSLSYDIIKAHGGSLTVESREGEGCTFIIRLPNGG
ncbi:GHKL domain-containing protein [Spirosoma rhododendri]|uniref:histidine kinase n=1 Tax=Spirosoma rhododendri TaxID=2728024 RepID=A0A7L5DV74_9BACT|nr:GHKL domain-containing protein [Spirosoma rhododendri]